MPGVDIAKRRIQQKKYREANRERRLKYSREYTKRIYISDRKRILEKNRLWRKNNPDKIKARDVRRFNLTLDDYYFLLEQQNGVCAICGQPETHVVYGKKKSLSIDHDSSCCPGRTNSCGKCIRGLLCSRCNTAIGLFEDNIEVLEMAINYIKTNRKAIQAYDGGEFCYPR